jgi:hypothetical protein
MILSEHVNGQDLRQTVQAVSQATLPFEADGYKCTTEMVYDVLLKAASDGISIEAACQDMPHVVDGNTIRAVRNDHLDIAQRRVHEQELNQALARAWPAQLQSKQLEGAIDIHDEPFYGKDESLRAVACRGTARDGTTRFVRTASAYVVYRQLRLTLALTFVLAEDSTRAVGERL